jgi:hypothetical protein
MRKEQMKLGKEQMKLGRRVRCLLENSNIKYESPPSSAEGSDDEHRSHRGSSMSSVTFDTSDRAEGRGDSSSGGVGDGTKEGGGSSSEGGADNADSGDSIVSGAATRGDSEPPSEVSGGTEGISQNTD